MEYGSRYPDSVDVDSPEVGVTGRRPSHSSAKKVIQVLANLHNNMTKCFAAVVS